MSLHTEYSLDCRNSQHIVLFADSRYSFNWHTRHTQRTGGGNTEFCATNKNTNTSHSSWRTVHVNLLQSRLIGLIWASYRSDGLSGYVSHPNIRSRAMQCSLVIRVFSLTLYHLYICHMETVYKYHVLILLWHDVLKQNMINYYVLNDDNFASSWIIIIWGWAL